MLAEQKNLNVGNYTQEYEGGKRQKMDGIWQKTRVLNVSST